MDASSKIQRSIHDVRLTYKYVSRILGTYHTAGGELIPRFKIFFQHKSTKIRKRVYTFRTSYIKIP